MTVLTGRPPIRLGDCRGVLVDSNVLLDVATEDPTWSGWSGRAMAECAERVPLMINPIIFAEVSIGYETGPRSTPLPV
jgi:hypothetical protein